MNNDATGNHRIRCSHTACNLRKHELVSEHHHHHHHHRRRWVGPSLSRQQQEQEQQKKKRAGNLCVDLDLDQKTPRTNSSCSWYFARSLARSLLLLLLLLLLVRRRRRRFFFRSFLLCVCRLGVASRYFGNLNVYLLAARGDEEVVASTKSKKVRTHTIQHHTHTHTHTHTKSIQNRRQPPHSFHPNFFLCPVS